MTRKITYCGIIASFAIILSYFEGLIPPLVPIPGVKLGFANLAVVVGLYVLGKKEGFFISFIRIIAIGFLFGSFSSIMYSLSGGMLSLVFMILGKKTNLFSIVGVSVIGGVMHNIGQIIVATLVVSNIKLLYYTPILIISGIGTGLIIGIISYWVNNNIEKNYSGHKDFEKSC